MFDDFVVEGRLIQDNWPMKVNVKILERDGEHVATVESTKNSLGRPSRSMIANPV